MQPISRNLCLSLLLATPYATANVERNLPLPSGTPTAEQVAHQILDHGHARRAAHEDDLVDALRG